MNASKMLSLISVIALVLCAIPLWAVDSGPLFEGEELSKYGITLGGWGSGMAVDNNEATYVIKGSHSIKISSASYYQGGRLDFSKPILLVSGTPDPSLYIQLTLIFDDMETVGPSYSEYDITPYSVPKVKNLRFLLISDTGQVVSVISPANPMEPDSNRMPIAIPVGKIKMPEGVTEFKMKSLAIFTESKSTFYLGDIRIVTDAARIQVDPLPDKVQAANDLIYFQPIVRAGVSSLNFAWDFGDGIAEAATPKTRIVSHIYPNAGEYVATLTVSDALGIKSPVKVTTKISIN